MRLSWIARGAANAERMRWLMQARGFTPNGHRLWDGCERGDLCGSYPDYVLAAVLIRERTTVAIRSKASREKITRPRGKPWDDTNEIWRLKIYATGTKEEVLSAFPGRTWGAIAGAARKRGHRRPKQRPRATGDRLFDEVRFWASNLGYSMSDLDAMAGTGAFFTKGSGAAGRGNHANIARAVRALGGHFYAQWET